MKQVKSILHVVVQKDLSYFCLKRHNYGEGGQNIAAKVPMLSPF